MQDLTDAELILIENALSMQILLMDQIATKRERRERSASWVPQQAGTATKSDHLRALREKIRGLRAGAS